MSDDRTLEPTRKRREQARSEGRVAATPFLGGVIVWLAVFAFLSFVFATGNRGWIKTLTDVSHAPAGIPASHELTDFVRERVFSVASLLLPGLLVVLAISVLSRFAQVGFLWVPNRVSPNFSRVDPANRWNQLLSPDSLVQFANSLLLVCVALSLVGYGIWNGRDQIAGALGMDVQFALSLLSRWGLRLGVVLLVFALLDYAYQRQRFEASLRMTPGEMRAEVKAVQGSGDVLAERRRRADSR